MELGRPSVELGQLRRTVMRAAGLLVAASLMACGSDNLVMNRAPSSTASTIHALDVRFAVTGTGRSEPTQTILLHSTVRGRLHLIPLDDPPLVVGSVAIERMELRSAERVATMLPAGEWSFMVRRASGGTIDAIWLEDAMPTEVEGLTRFLLGELQTCSACADAVLEETPAGFVEARYVEIGGALSGAKLRARQAPEGAPQSIRGATIRIDDELGVLAVLSGLFTRSQLFGRDELVSENTLVAWRGSAMSISHAETAELKERIEALSSSEPDPMVIPPRSKQEIDELRRAAESWDVVRSRLRTTHDAVDATLVHRAAAHLSGDPTLVDELEMFVYDPNTTVESATIMVDALADCGTNSCQEALTRMFVRDGEPRADVLAAIARVREPSAKTVDLVLEVSKAGNEVTRGMAGVVLSHFADVDPSGANMRVEALLDDIQGCSPRLDAWFELLGNAGLSAAKAALMTCLARDVPALRRAAAAGAMRRMPDADVTRTLVRLAAEDPDERVQFACLRALASRDVQDGELAPLVNAGVVDWRSVALNSLLDILARVSPPAKSVESLLQELQQSENEEVVERARLVAEASHP